ncbi:hypothetical protein GCM10028807_41110 [Spirosoma daeguense]
MKYSLWIGLFLAGTTPIFAQNLLGISTSRFGGTNQLYINPALAADSPSKFHLNIATVNLHANNNYVRYQAPFSLLTLISGNVPNQYRNSDGTVHFETSYTRETLDGNPKNGMLAGEVRGPAFLVRSGERSAFAVTTRFRAVGQITGASESMLAAVRAGLGDGALYGIPSGNNQFAANTNTYAELGFTYAGTVWDNEDGQKLLLGATAKFLLGYNAQQLINRGMQYRIASDPNNPNSAFLEATQLDATLNYTTFLQNRKLSIPNLLSSSLPGRGLGLDLGFTYINQYDADSPALRLGAAMTDIGGISYKGEAYNYANIEQNPVRFRSSDFNNLNGSLDIVRVIQTKLNNGRSPDKNSFQAGLPTSLNLSMDYQQPGGLGINVTYWQDMRAQSAMAIHQPSMLAVTPRYDVRWLGISIPIAYLNRGLTAGASLRVGPAWLGTDNLLGLMGTRSNSIAPRGLDIYGGLSFGIGEVDD